MVALAAAAPHSAAVMTTRAIKAEMMTAVAVEAAADAMEATTAATTIRPAAADIEEKVGVSKKIFPVLLIFSVFFIIIFISYFLHIFGKYL